MSSTETPRILISDGISAESEATEVLGSGHTANTSERYERGTQIGRYVILDELGTGGMSVVYGAYDPELDRKVAIKVLMAEGIVSAATFVSSSASPGSRLLREAQALARLSHPHVLPVFDVGTIDGRVFLAMEHVDGSTLAEWLKAEPRPWREVVAKFLDAGRGLAAAHAADFIHRDFKPHNVLVGKDGAVRVMDFGLVRRGEVTAQTPEELSFGREETTSDRELLSQPLTIDGAIVGTPAYMAPEQLRGDVVDAKADQYAFCSAPFRPSKRAVRSTVCSEALLHLRTSNASESMRCKIASPRSMRSSTRGSTAKLFPS